MELAEGNTSTASMTRGEWLVAVLSALAFIGTFYILFDIYGNLARIVDDAMVEKTNDDQAYVASKIASTGSARFIVLGDSGMREAFFLDSEMADSMANISGDSFVNLASSAQTPVESLFLTHLVRPNSNHTIVLFLSYSALHQENPFERLERGAFLHSPTVLLGSVPVYPEFWSSPGVSQWFALKAARQWVRRQFSVRLRRWIQTAIYQEPFQAYQPYRYDTKNRPESAEMSRKADQVTKELLLYFDANLAYQAAALDALYRLTSQNHASLIVAAAPGRPPIDERTRMHYEAFQQHLRTFAEQRGIDWLNLNDRIDWQDDDFFDLLHVSSQGRRKWSQAFIDWQRDHHGQRHR